MFPNQVSYRILNPTSTHFRPATCEEVGCIHNSSGWASIIDESTDLGQRQAAYIRGKSGRGFREYTGSAWNEKMRGTVNAAGEEYVDIANGLTVFAFHAGQQCFDAAKHLTNIGRNPLFVVDTPADNGRIRRRKHSSADSWGDDLHTHTDDLLGEIGIS